MSSFPRSSLTALAVIFALTASACADDGAESGARSDTSESTVTQETASETAEGAASRDAGAEPASEPAPGEDIIATSAPGDWRTVDPDRLLVIETGRGPIYVETAPEFAPNHVDRMEELARMDWFRMKVWHRVIDGFMAQGGGALSDPTAAPDLPPLEAEFTVMRGPELEISEVQQRRINPRRGSTEALAGFWMGMPAGTQPIAQAAIRADGQVESWLLHCPGTAAMARTADPNSARAQFYIVRDDARHLDTQYTPWGYTRAGLDIVQALPVGSLSDDPYFEPDYIRNIVPATELDASERLTIEVMDTTSDTFQAYLDAVALANNGELPDICDIEVPVRIQDPTE
jgi:peptidylprolyl isomerase